MATVKDTQNVTRMPRLRVYTATTYELHAGAEIYVDWLNTFLRQHNFYVINTSRWIFDEKDTDTVQEKAAMDFADIDQSDLVVAHWPFGKGTSAEIAWAVAKGKQVIMYIPKDFYDKGHIPCMPVGLGEPFRSPDQMASLLAVGKPVITTNLGQLKKTLTQFTANLRAKEVGNGKTRTVTV